MICWEFDLFSSWMIVWAYRVNGGGWCLEGGRGFWLKGPCQIPSVSWIYYHSLQLLSIITVISHNTVIITHPLNSLICAKDIKIIVLLLQMMGEWEGWGWFIYDRVWVGDSEFYHIFSIFRSIFVQLIIVFSWLVGSCCVCFIVPFLLVLSLIRLLRRHKRIETVLFVL